MNTIVNGKLYRNLSYKKATAQGIYFTITGLTVPVSIFLGIAVSWFFCFGFCLTFLMLWLGVTIWEVSPEESKFKYTSRLVPETGSQRDLVASLNTLLSEYEEEIRYITSPDMLFDEVWDQIEISKITDSSVYEYNKKLTDIQRVCEKIKKQNLIAGRSASSDVVDLALKTAKEFK